MEEARPGLDRPPPPRRRGRVAEAAVTTLEGKVKAEIDEAVKFAEDSPPADEYASFTYKE